VTEPVRVSRYHKYITSPCLDKIPNSHSIAETMLFLGAQCRKYSMYNVYAAPPSRLFFRFAWSLLCRLRLFMLDDLLAPVSTREKPARLRHARAHLALGAQPPKGSGDAERNRHHHRRICLPVGWLRVPAAGRRPDVLWIWYLAASSHGWSGASMSRG